MRHLSLVVLISILAGCTTITAPPEPPPVSVLGNYFWPARAGVYQYRGSNTSGHQLSIDLSGAQYLITDRTDSAFGASILTAWTSSTGTEIGQLSDRTFIRLPHGGLIVRDSVISGPRPLHVTAMGDFHAGFGLHGPLFATDRGLFAYDHDSLVDLHSPLPAIRVSDFFESSSGLWYVVSVTDSRIYYSDDAGSSWNQIMLPSGNLTASAMSGELYAAIGGVGVFRIENGKSALVVSTPHQMITSIAAIASREILLGTESGLILHYSGNTVVGIDSLPTNGTPQPIRKLYYSGDRALFVGTDSRFFLLSDHGLHQLESGNAEVSDVWEDMGDVYYSTVDGRVYRDHNDVAQYVSTVAPSLRMVLPTGGRKFAIAGDRLYVAESGYLVWNPVRAAAPDLPSWTPGNFRLLPNNADSAWIAGRLLLTNQPSFPIFSYTGRYLEHADDIVLDGKHWHDVIVVRYAVETAVSVDTVSAPQYVIFFQKDQGPIRIETTRANYPLSTLQLQ